MPSWNTCHNYYAKKEAIRSYPEPVHPTSPNSRPISLRCRPTLTLKFEERRRENGKCEGIVTDMTIGGGGGGDRKIYPALKDPRLCLPILLVEICLGEGKTLESEKGKRLACDFVTS
jgi:hypothetical protein